MNDKKESVLDLAGKQNRPELLQVIGKYKAERMIKQQEKMASSEDLRRARFVKDYH